jgi:hypothetical protein
MSRIFETPPLNDLVSDSALREYILKQLDDERICVIRGVAKRDEIGAWIAYLSQIGRGSLSGWQAILPNCPNFHRISRWDERSYVKACFHQFSFFPWNDDIFAMFNRFRRVFELRNLLSRAEPAAYLGYEAYDDCIARLSFQFYPKGIGGMNEHIDPVGPHQAVVPLLMMSELGRDFGAGGIFVRTTDGEVVAVENYTNPGDVVLFSPKLAHGVATIDPEKEADWLSFEGRWMGIFAVNKLASNSRVAEAIDLAVAK